MAITELAGRGLIAMVEPFISHRIDSRVRNDLSAEAMIRAISVASGLGSTSAYTWLKVPVVPDMERVMAASTLPALLLGGEVPDDPEQAFTGWQKALQLPNVKGIVAGRSLLYPVDGDVARAVDTAVGLLLRRDPDGDTGSALVNQDPEDSSILGEEQRAVGQDGDLALGRSEQPHPDLPRDGPPVRVDRP
jgi:hypothetical protein